MTQHSGKVGGRRKGTKVQYKAKNYKNTFHDVLPVSVSKRSCHVFDVGAGRLPDAALGRMS